MASMATHPHALLHARQPPHGWRHWPGQFCIHPETVVLDWLDPEPGYIACEWGLVAVTAFGRSWWYGYAPIDIEDRVECGWCLLPRDPEQDPSISDRGGDCGG